MKKLKYLLLLPLIGAFNVFAVNISYTPSITPGATFWPGTSLSRINDGNTNTNVPDSYQVHPTNAKGKTITMVLDRVSNINFATFYNRPAANCCSDRINGAKLIFKDSTGTALYTYTFSSAGDVVTISDPSGVINGVSYVELTDFKDDNQNFREITFDVTADIILSKTTSTVAENAGTDTFTAVLTAKPTSNVVFNVSSNDTNEATVSPAILTFTPANWNIPQIITITGVNDNRTSNDSAIITIAVRAGASASEYSALANRNIAVTLINVTVATPIPALGTYGLLLLILLFVAMLYLHRRKKIM